jgi:PAS domain-containing protein
MTTIGSNAAPGAPGANIEAVDLHRLLVDNVRDYAIFALDATGHIVTWNAGAERIKGYIAGEIIGKHFSIFYPPEDRASGKPACELEVSQPTAWSRSSSRSCSSVARSPVDTKARALGSRSAETLRGP